MNPATYERFETPGIMHIEERLILFTIFPIRCVLTESYLLR